MNSLLAIYMIMISVKQQTFSGLLLLLFGTLAA
jgi:hypothetical protein